MAAKIALHMYAVEILKADGTREIIEIFARNRASAEKKANAFGSVASVNMVG